MISGQDRRAVFLDRDGTLIEDCGWLAHPRDVRFLPGAVEALRRLQEEELLLFIVTNQGGVAEGAMTEHEVRQVNDYVVAKLAKQGIRISDVYVCPHKRSDGCACIKPNPYFLDRAASQYGIDLSRSFVVGDHPHDVEFARRAGAQGLYVCTGHGLKHLEELPPHEMALPDLRAAVEWILSTRPGTGPSFAAK